MKIFFITIIALFCFINTSFGIEDVRKVYLNEAINAALKNNIDLQVAQIELNIAKNNIKSANRFQNPSFDAYYFMGASGRTEPRQLGATQEIEIAKRNARKKLAELNFKLSEKEFDYTTFDLKMDVREAYINLVATKSIFLHLNNKKNYRKNC